MFLNTSPPAHLTELYIIHGELPEYSRAPDLPPRASNIKRLNFQFTNITEAALSTLSIDFPTLDYLELDSCDYEQWGDTQTINISMLITAIKQIKMDVGELEGDTSLFLVSSIDQGITNYYLTVAEEDGTITQITKAQFDPLQEAITDHLRNIIAITAKDIEEVYLAPWGINRNITISVP